MEKKIALVVGGTGLIGSYLLKFLLVSPEYEEVRALTRQPIPIKHEKLRQINVDFDKLADGESTDLYAVDDVFCTLGTTIKKAKSKEQFRKVDFEYPTQIAQLARAAGAKQFLLVSALGANSSSAFFYNQVKGEVEGAITKLGYPALQIFRPSLLLGVRREFRFGEVFAEKIMKVVGCLCIGPLRRFKPIKAQMVAAAMVKVANQHPVGIQIYESSEIETQGQEPYSGLKLSS